MREKQRQTLNARIAKDKKSFLEILEKNPVTSIACERSGVSKATYHRWKAEDKEFAEKVNEAMTEGKGLVNDIAKAQLISLIKEKNFQGIKFWLQSNDPDFRPTIEVDGEVTVEKKLSSEDEEMLRVSLAKVAGMLSPETKNHHDDGHEQHSSDTGTHGV
jgi:hypothetical protein